MKNNREISLWLIGLFMSISLFSFSQEEFPFIENKGQLPSSVFSKVKVPGGSIYIEKGKFIYSFYNSKQLQERHDLLRNEDWIDAHSFSANFINSNPNSEIILAEKSIYFENFYNTKNWTEQVYFYKNITQENIYNGIDLKMYFSNNNLKYDLIIHPNYSTKKIKIKYSGQGDIYLKNGNLIVKTSVNSVTELTPYSYQIINGKEIEVESHFKLKNDILSFQFPKGYDKSEELIIDPTLIFSTYSGSTADNFGYTATYDRDGFLYSGSTVFGVGYPTTLGAYQINYANSSGGTDIGITKYDTTGTLRIYSTYLGGSRDELPHSMIVNNLDELFIFGTTGSEDYPTTTGCYNENFSGGTGFSPSGLGVSFPNGSDIIVSRLSANGGNLLASTYIGGSGNDGLNTAQKLKRNYADEVRGEIDIDQNNNIYLATSTYSTDFPITSSFQQNNNGNQEGCIVKMDNQLSTIIWSAYLGGDKDDAIYSLAMDKNDNVFVTGGTTSDNFPVSTNAYQNSYLDSLKADAFITHISSDGNTIINSTYFGSEFYDQSYFVELNSEEEIYIFGQTKALGNSLVYNANYFTAEASQFIAILSNNLQQLLRSTVVGTGKGTPDISPTAFLVDVCNNIYISGWGSGTGNGPLSTLNMPITANAFQNTTDGNDFYIMILDDGLNNLVYGTYFGGSQSAEHVDGGTSRFDKKGIIYQSVCAGCGNHDDFPIYPNPGAVSATNNSNNCNNGVFKFDFNFPIILADFDAPWLGCNNTISFTDLSTHPQNTTYFWDFGDGNNSTQINPTHQYLTPGIYTITLIASSPIACNLSDTIIKQIYILSNSSSNLQEVEVCKGESVQIGVLPINDPSISYFWFPSVGLNNVAIPNPIATVNSSTQYQLIISDRNCADTIYQWVYTDSININASDDTSFCKDPIQLSANTSGTINSIIWSTNINFTDTISSSNFYIANNIGTFYILVENDNCSHMDSVKVSNDNISIDLSGITEICKGDSIFLKVDNLSSLDPIVFYSWESEYTLFFGSDSSSFISFPDSSTCYKVITTNTLGCFITDSIFVEVHNYPLYDSVWTTNSSIYNGEETELHISTEDNFIWNTNDTTKMVSLYPEYSNWYYVEIYNSFCQLEDSIYIEVKNVFCDESRILIPNAFSPNEDQKNDFYRIIDEDKIITKFKLEIFNRFGEKVYFSEDVNESWNGYFKGELLASQVFDYYLEIKCIGNKTLFEKGNITLIR
ncbi:MAG: T9SS type B sorting domain-containing protein [Flavobacteriales bacterium]|jgi:gliding motility-associated-like protein|nr:T9SS type B sorting domain-containing protein [Flavobacteriales bacterium]MBT7481930.1 T9SS type B sorting domain-containing protein [Flavobacteriales bacterium]